MWAIYQIDMCIVTQLYPLNNHNDELYMEMPYNL